MIPSTIDDSQPQYVSPDSPIIGEFALLLHLDSLIDEISFIDLIVSYKWLLFKEKVVRSAHFLPLVYI